MARRPSELHAIARILKFAHEIGIPVAPRHPEHSWAWDGRTLATVKMNASDLAHDIAHWLVCSKKRRSMPDYGLEDGPQSGIKLKRKIKRAKEQIEEEHASILGMLIEKHFLSKERWATTFNDHGWNQDPLPRAGYKMAIRLRYLIDKGFVDPISLAPCFPNRKAGSSSMRSAWKHSYHIWRLAMDKEYLYRAAQNEITRNSLESRLQNFKYNRKVKRIHTRLAMEAANPDLPELRINS